MPPNKKKSKNTIEEKSVHESGPFNLITRKRVVLKFPPSVVQTPLTYILAKEYDIKSNILRAEISPEESGTLVMEMDGTEDKLEEAIERIKGLGISLSEVARKVSFNMDKCIHCGACISVCLAGALKLDKDFHLQYIEPKCTLCEMCVTACPVDVVNIDI